MLKSYSRFILLSVVIFLISCSPVSDDVRGRNLLDSAEKDYLVGDYIESMKSVHEYIKASTEGEIESNPELDTRAYKFLGNIHLIYGDRLNASSYYSIALDNSDMIADKEEKLKLLYNLVILHSELGELRQTDMYIGQIKRLEGVDPGLKIYFLTMARALKEDAFGDKRISVEMMKKALDIVEEYKLESYLKYNPYRIISDFLLEAGRYTEALETLSEFEQLTRANRESPEGELECVQSFVNVYTRLGDNDNALMYQKRYEHLSDSLKSHQEFLKTSGRFSMPKKSTGRVGKHGLEIMIVSALVLVIVCWIIFRRRIKRVSGRLTPSDGEVFCPEDADMSGTFLQTKTEETTESIHKHPEIFNRIRNEMEIKGLYSDPELTARALASIVDANAKYVSQAIRTHTGKNFRGYLNSLRIKEACRLLSSESEVLSVQEVSKRVGFVSQSVFIDAFRRETGMTPSGFQKNSMSRYVEFKNERLRSVVE